jgi:histidyl-tRNA synthetase
VPATGFSIGVSRLMTALKNLGKLERRRGAGPRLVTIMDRDTDSLARYQKMVQDLRGARHPAELFQGNPKQFGKQLQYADRRGCPLAIIQGGDERLKARLICQIKDLIEGKRHARRTGRRPREKRHGRSRRDPARPLRETARAPCRGRFPANRT